MFDIDRCSCFAIFNSFSSVSGWIVILILLYVTVIINRIMVLVFNTHGISI